MRLRKITLLRPNIGNYRSSDAFEPLVMGVLAARTPQHVEVSFYDDKLEEIPTDDSPDLVAMSVETFTARRAYNLAESYRRRGIPVVMGGHHPSLAPQEARLHADAVVVGDAEGAWDELLADFTHGRMQPVYRGDSHAFLCDYKIDRGIFAGKRYVPVNLVQYGRGCKHRCDFCSVHSFYGDRLYLPPVDRVISEIRALPCSGGRTPLMFVDDNLYSSIETLTELLEKLRPLDIRWACQISLDVVQRPELLDLMARAGCRMVIVGFESLHGGNLELMSKAWNRSFGDYEDIVKEFHSRRIGICGTFVFGYDDDTEETIEAACAFAKKARLEMAQLNPLTPTPGTAFYERLMREGRLLYPDWWLNPDYKYGDPIVTPPAMSAEKFADCCFAVKKSFYEWRTLAKRVLLPATGFDLRNMAIFGLANLISRREVYKKQRRPIGS